jgi:hypothetical protein
MGSVGVRERERETDKHWLISISVMSSRFVHIVLSDRISFVFKAEWIPSCFFIALLEEYVPYKKL